MAQEEGQDARCFLAVSGNTSAPFGGTCKGGKQVNEDSYCTWQSPGKHVVTGCVYDGHGGYNGLLASKAATEYTLEALNAVANECEQWELDQWKEFLQKLFKEIHDKIRAVLTGSDSRTVDAKGVVRQANGDPVHGGTTGSVVVQFTSKVDGITIVSANVGDSHGFLCSRKGKKTEFLTVDHGPESQDEWKRVQSLNATEYPVKLMFVYDKSNVYRKYECPLVFLADGSRDQTYVRNPWGNGLHPTNVRYEAAVYAVTPRSIVQDAACIAMTRSLGDFYAQQFGLSWVPSITVRKLGKPGDEEEKGNAKEARRTSVHENLPTQEEETAEEKEVEARDYTVILGSDGIWDCWKYEDLTEYVNDILTKNKEDVEKSVAGALAESVVRAKANFGVKHFDDATLLGWRVTV